VAKIKFANVGRNNFNGAIKIPDGLSAKDIAAIAFRQARRHTVSVNLDVQYDAKTNRGLIFAGLHTAGTFKVLSPRPRRNNV